MKSRTDSVRHPISVTGPEHYLRACWCPSPWMDNPPEDSRLVVEEPFGPILPLLK